VVRAAAVLLFVLVLLLSPLLVDMADGAPVGRTPYTIAKFYSPGVFARVAKVRGLPVSERMAAVTDCGRIGQYVTASINGHVDTYLVADCSHPRDRARHIREGLVIEVNYSAAKTYFPRGEGQAPAYIIRFTKRR
jgi:hypothetical protein